MWDETQRQNGLTQRAASDQDGQSSQARRVEEVHLCCVEVCCLSFESVAEAVMVVKLTAPSHRLDCSPHAGAEFERTPPRSSLHWLFFPSRHHHHSQPFNALKVATPTTVLATTVLLSAALANGAPTPNDTSVTLYSEAQQQRAVLARLGLAGEQYKASRLLFTPSDAVLRRPWRQPWTRRRS